MLAVGVDPAAVRIAPFVRLVVAGCDPGSQPAVLAERDDDGVVCRRNGGGRVRRAVVDHEHVRVGETGVQLLEHGGQAALLVPGGNEDDGVGVGHDGSVVTARRRRSRCERRQSGAPRRSTVSDIACTTSSWSHESQWNSASRGASGSVGSSGP